jgi:O-antigen ligase
MIFMLWSVFLLRFVIDINNIPGPSNLFHFGFMREQTNIYGLYAFITEDDFTISYHLPGFLSLVGLSLFLTDVEKYSRLMKWYVWILAFIVIFYTGARQNLLAYIILLMFYIFTLKEYSFIYKCLAIGTVVAVSTVTLLSINSDVIQNVLSSSTISGAIEVSGRSEFISRGLELFNRSPFWGVGFGHYSFRGMFDEYPHNIVVELLTEIGIIGFSFIIILCCYVVFKSRQVLLFLHNHNFKPYLVLFPLLVRAMISLNMTSNIIVFSFIFSLNCLNWIPQEGD